MSNKYFDTKEGSLEESVLDVWAEAADDMELDERRTGAAREYAKKVKSAYQRAQAKKGGVRTYDQDDITGRGSAAGGSGIKTAGRIGGKMRIPGQRWSRIAQYGLKGHETKAQRRARLTPGLERGLKTGRSKSDLEAIQRDTKARLKKKHSPEKTKELEKAKAMIRRQDKADAMTSGPMRDKLRKAKILVRQAEQETFNAELLDLQYMAETLKERIQFLEGR